MSPATTARRPVSSTTRDFASTVSARGVKTGARGVKTGPLGGSKRARRLGRWAAMRVLWTHSSLARVRKCHRVPLGYRVGIARRGSRAHFSGLMTCGSVWACPLCSAKIQAQRTTELLRAVEYAYTHGLRVATVTLTMRHNARSPLKPIWDALSSAWAAGAGRDRAARRAMAAVGLAGWARTVEATHGRNGWHLHIHGLLFYEGGDLRPVADAMWAGWLRRLEAHGFDADRKRGIHLRELDLEGARAEAASYLTKATYEQAAAAREIAGQLGKSGRRGNRTPFQILEDVGRYGLESDLALWREWEATSHGRHALTWRMGTRELLLSGERERTDEEIAAENDGAQVDIAVIRREVWQTLLARRLELELVHAIEAGEADSYAAVVAFMLDHGLPPPRRA